jgi:hypothetical protein
MEYVIYKWAIRYIIYIYFFFVSHIYSGPKHKRRKKTERRRGSRDRRGDYFDETSPSPGGHRDARYNDMAPKYVLIYDSRTRK